MLKSWVSFHWCRSVDCTQRNDVAAAWMQVSVFWDTGCQGEKGRHSIGPSDSCSWINTKGKRRFLFMRNHFFPFLSVLDIRYHAAAQFLLAFSCAQGKLRIKAGWGCRKLNKLSRNKWNSSYLCQKLDKGLGIKKNSLLDKVSTEEQKLYYHSLNKGSKKKGNSPFQNVEAFPVYTWVRLLTECRTELLIRCPLVLLCTGTFLVICYNTIKNQIALSGGKLKYISQTENKEKALHKRDT